MTRESASCRATATGWLRWDLGTRSTDCHHRRVATGATGPEADDRPAGGVVVRPARDLAEALRAGELLRPTYDQAERPVRPTWSTCATSGRGWRWPSCWSRWTRPTRCSAR